MERDDTTSRKAAIEMIMGQPPEAHYPSWYAEQIKKLPPSRPLILTCDGCRHVGTYDTDFPCSRCIRREKDYYEQE